MQKATAASARNESAAGRGWPLLLSAPPPQGRRAPRAPRHNRGRAAEKCKRRLPHPPVTNRQQVVDAPFICPPQQFHWIFAVLRRLPFSQRSSRYLLADRFADGDALFHRRPEQGLLGFGAPS